VRSPRRPVGEDVPVRHLEIQLPDAEDVRTRREIDVSGRLPDSRTTNEPERRVEADIDAVERDEIVEQVIRKVGRKPPGQGRASLAGSADARDPEGRHHILPAEDKRELPIQTG
jgi:hypothetical protein